jgi:hypothetical protein
MSELTGLSGIIPTYRPNRAFAPETGRSCQTRQTIHYGIIKQHVRLSRRIGLNRDLRGLIRTCPTVSPQIGLFRLFQGISDRSYFNRLCRLLFRLFGFVLVRLECRFWRLCPECVFCRLWSGFVAHVPDVRFALFSSQRSRAPRCMPGSPNTNNATPGQDPEHPPFGRIWGGRTAYLKP